MCLYILVEISCGILIIDIELATIIKLANGDNYFLPEKGNGDGSTEKQLAKQG